MRLALAVTGSLKQHMEREARNGARAVTQAMRAATEGLKTDLRQQVVTGGLGQRLARAWRGQTYPRGQDSMGAAGLVFTKAERIVRAFEEGALIRSQKGFWLAIPTESAPKRGVGGKRISPSTFPENVYGPLRFVYRPGKPGLLVVDNLRARQGKRGGFGRAGKRALARGEVTTVVMFVLVPQVRLRKRLDIDAAARVWQDRLPRLILDRWNALDAVAD